MTTLRRPVYLFPADNDEIHNALVDIYEMSAGETDEVIDLRVQDFLEACHQRWPDVVRVKGKPNLRVVK